jgi:NAD(P)-dependent dehydrogenase (short-subunit alcohol dehydrogenase family)
MHSLTDKTMIVAGATGNVGPFVVRALLARGATVGVPSRSPAKLEELRAEVDGPGLDRLHLFQGSLGDESDAERLGRRITAEIGAPDGVVAAMGDFVAAPSLLDAGADDLRRALEAYLLSNFIAARTFLPQLQRSGGTYVLLQGPLAFELYPGLGADLISIATAGQHMLFRSLAQQAAQSRARVVELVIHAFIRDRRTQPQSPLSGEAIGAYAAHLLAGAGPEMHGRSIELRSPEQLDAIAA